MLERVKKEESFVVDRPCVRETGGVAEIIAFRRRPGC